MLNQFALTGHLCRDADVKEAASGTAVWKNAMGWNRKVNGENEAHFFDLVAFGKTAESLAQHTGKGKKLTLWGSLSQNRWTTKDGDNRSRVELVVYGWEFAESRTVETDDGLIPPPDLTDDDIPF